MKLHKSHRLFAKIAHKLGIISELQLHETISACKKIPCSQYLQDIVDAESWNKIRLIYLEKIVAQMLVRYDYLSEDEYEKIMAMEIQNAQKNKKIWEPIILSQGIITADMEHCFFKGFSKKGGDVPGLVDENLLAVKNGFVAAEDYDSSLLRIGDYTIETTVYEGKKYKVYKAWHEKLGKHFTIKLFNFSMSSESMIAIRSFSKEMKVIKKLRHKNIIPVHDIGVVDQQHYIAMPYVKGNSLAHELDSGKQFTIHQALAIVLRLAETIGITHRHYLVHRQLTPENIIVDESGNPYIKGFGQATLLEKVFGKDNYISYQAPEQIISNKVSAQSDVYSLGIVLYEMLMNKHPFVSQNKLWNKLQIALFHLPWSTKEIPPPVKIICERATAKNVKYRYADGFKMAVDIRCYLNGQALAGGLLPWHYSFTTFLRHYALYFCVFLLMGFSLLFYRSHTQNISANKALQTQKKLAKSTIAASQIKTNHNMIKRYHQIINEYKVLLNTNYSLALHRDYVKALNLFFDVALRVDTYLAEYVLYLLEEQNSRVEIKNLEELRQRLQASKGKK